MTVAWSLTILALAVAQGWKCVEHLVGMARVFRSKHGPVEEPYLFRLAARIGWRPLVLAVNVLWRGPVLLCGTALVLAGSTEHAWHAALFIASVALVSQLVLQLTFPLAVAVAVSLGRRVRSTEVSGFHFARVGGDSPAIDPALTFIALAGTITLVFMAEILVAKQVRPASLAVAHHLGFGVLDAFYFSFCTLTTIGDSTVEPRLLLAKIVVAGELACSGILLSVLASSVLTRQDGVRRDLGSGGTVGAEGLEPPTPSL